jgi:hypothetical protein
MFDGRFLDGNGLDGGKFFIFASSGVRTMTKPFEMQCSDPNISRTNNISC